MESPRFLNKGVDGFQGYLPYDIPTLYRGTDHLTKFDTSAVNQLGEPIDLTRLEAIRVRLLCIAHNDS